MESRGCLLDLLLPAVVVLGLGVVLLHPVVVFLGLGVDVSSAVASGGCVFGPFAAWQAGLRAGRRSVKFFSFLFQIFFNFATGP